ncbi:MAG: DMT family transporter [Alphaproteobacteria bacterium]|nr:DMT family transporter [Alphaproteobacteria bacterium]
MPLSDNMRGALIMMLSMAAFTLNGFLIRSVMNSISLYQTMLMQGALAVILLLLIAGFRKEITYGFSTQNWKIVILRSCAEVGAIIFYFIALSYLPLPSMTFVLQIAPLLVTLAVSGLIREETSAIQYLFLVLGLIGAMLVLRPSGIPMSGFQNYQVIANLFGPWAAAKALFWDHFNTSVFYALATLGFIVLRDVATRKLDSTVRTTNVAIIAAAAITTVGAIGTASIGWSEVGTAVLLLVAFSSILLVCMFLASIEVMRIGDVGLIQNFRYSAVIFAVILGIIVFGERPDGFTLLGGLLIVCVGVFALLTRKTA